MIKWEIKEEGYCKSYDEVPEGATVTEVNGKVVVGSCCICEKALFDDSDYQEDAIGDLYCKKHKNKMFLYDWGK